MLRILLLAASLAIFASLAYSQSFDKNLGQAEAGPIRSSAAYAEVVARKLELQSDLEAVAPEYTDTNPKILDLRFEIGAIDKALEKIYGVKPSETGKLTQALGRMLVKRASLETDLARLMRTYTNEKVEVKRAKRRVEIYDAAIKEILP